MNADMHLEPLIATAYAMLLVLIAGALEWMARHSKKRSDRYHTEGFRFQAHLDHWECPTGARLLRAEIDNKLRVIRYRAPAQSCNNCAVKANCTNSNNGREIEVPLDPWLRTEIGRFHRAISLVLLSLAASITAVECVRHDHGTEFWLPIGALTIISLLVVKAAQGLRHRAVVSS